jgi:dTDP-4-amino-4,6-dideoxygalactose transaminase
VRFLTHRARNITSETIKVHLENVDDISAYSMVLPVHLMGYPADMDEIKNIAENYSLTMFEDSAQAHGSLYKGQRCGSMSVASVFSFYIAHNIQVGEMGARARDAMDEGLKLTDRDVEA